MFEERAQSFGAIAELYDHYRPSPPAGAATLLGDIRGLKVLEVAAGTGLWSRFLLEQGADLTIVEPDEKMRAVLERRSPQVHALVGTAENLPVADASFDVVVISSAWHWFRQPEATQEMARVLSDGGRLFVLWNGFSRSLEWVNELSKLRDGKKDPSVRPRSWTAPELAHGLFVDVTDISLDWTWPRTTDEVVKLFGTYSGVSTRTEAERAEIGAKLRDLLGQVTVNDVVDVPMTLRGTVATRSTR
jgi:SAM-dependent methyltransferase